MAAVPQTVFEKSCLLIGGTVYPIYPDAEISVQDNYDVPPIVGNLWQWNYGQGLIQPTVQVRFVIRDKATECFALAFLSLFMTRSSDVAYDTPVISGGVTFWNGREGWLMNGAKPSAFTIGASGAGDLTFTASFVGTSVTPVTVAPTFTGWSNHTIMRFPQVSFNEPFANAVWNWQLSYSNNMSPDLSFNGTQYATTQNAGMPTVGFNCSMQAASTRALVQPNNGTYPPPATPDTIAITIAGANVTRVFTLNNPVLDNGKSLRISAPRNMKNYNFLCLGADGTTTGPLTIT